MKTFEGVGFPAPSAVPGVKQAIKIDIDTGGINTACE